MSLLNNIIGNLTGSSDGQLDVGTLVKWVINQGGLDQIINQFQQGGLNDIIQSWLSGDAKSFLPVSAEQIQSIFGKHSITELASSLNLDTDKTSSLVSEYLPQAVSLISSKGENLDLDSLISTGSSLLGKFFK